MITRFCSFRIFTPPPLPETPKMAIQSSCHLLSRGRGGTKRKLCSSESVGGGAGQTGGEERLVSCESEEEEGLPLGGGKMRGPEQRVVGVVVEERAKIFRRLLPRRTVMGRRQLVLPERDEAPQRGPPLALPLTPCPTRPPLRASPFSAWGWSCCCPACAGRSEGSTRSPHRRWRSRSPRPWGRSSASYPWTCLREKKSIEYM